MENLKVTIIIPFFNGHQYLPNLINSLPSIFDTIIVDDKSDIPLTQEQIDQTWLPIDRGDSQIKVLQMSEKGYWAGAVDFGIRNCDTDVLILNQDTFFENNDWIDLIESYKDSYGYIGERIKGNHPAFGELGYSHGTFLYVRRDVIKKVGLFDSEGCVLWGSTALYQWRVARAGFQVLPLKEIPGFYHERKSNERYGSSIKQLLEDEPEKKDLLIQTPPLVSVVVPVYNYGKYLRDCINSLIGGSTSLGEMPGQTIQNFEIIVVDDASTDNSRELIQEVARLEQGIRYYFLEKNVGTAKTLNFGISKAVGKYITFLSADDMRESFSLEKLVEVCEANPHSFAYDDVWLFGEGERIKKWGVEEYDFEKLIWKNQVHAGILFPKQAWVDAGGYPPMMNDGREDWAFNIALGVKGWCGVHVKQFGYLYRREGHNRTATEPTQEKRRRFLEKIMNYFPDIYKGIRPMACCGKGRSNAMNMKNSSVSQNGAMKMATMVGQTGMTKIEYVGNKMTASWHGDTTHKDYTFGEDKPRGWVDNRDVGEKGKNGFLNMKDKQGNYLFRTVETVQQQALSEAVAIASNENVEKTASSEITVLKGQSIGRSTDSVQIVEDKKEVDFPDPTDLNAEQIKRLDLTLSQWKALYSAELAGRSRKGLTSWLEETIANWNS